MAWAGHHAAAALLPSRTCGVVYCQKLVTIVRDDFPEIALISTFGQTRNVAIHFIRYLPDVDGCMYMGAFSWRWRRAHWDTNPGG